jgi:hypothetical protein
MWVNYQDKQGKTQKAYLFYTEVSTIKQWMDLYDYDFTHLSKIISLLLEKQAFKSPYAVKDSVLIAIESELKYPKYANSAG